MHGHAGVGPRCNYVCSVDAGGFNLEQVACLLTFRWLEYPSWVGRNRNFTLKSVLFLNTTIGTSSTKNTIRYIYSIELSTSGKPWLGQTKDRFSVFSLIFF